MKVVASLTTLPDRYERLAKTLKSLTSQSYKLDKIYLAIPKRSRRLDKKYPKLPDEIKNIVEVVKVDTDYGPITKLYGGIKRENDPDTLIITFDDDVIYHKDVVKHLVMISKNNENVAICGTGAMIKYGIAGLSIYTSLDKFTWANGIIGFKVPEEGRYCDLVYGVGGVAYRRKFFPEKDIETLLFKLALDNTNLFFNDDVLISGYLNKQGIKRKVFPKVPSCLPGDVPDDALSKGLLFNMLPRMRRAIKEAAVLGYFDSYEDSEVTDSMAVKVGVVIFFVILFVLILLVFVLAGRRRR